MDYKHIIDKTLRSNLDVSSLDNEPNYESLVDKLFLVCKAYNESLNAKVKDHPMSKLTDETEFLKRKGFIKEGYSVFIIDTEDGRFTLNDILKDYRSELVVAPIKGKRKKPSRSDNKYWTGTRTFDNIEFENDLEDFILELEESLEISKG